MNLCVLGMELFKAGNRSQWETIKKWINDSDIYMLILGGRYGSIKPISKKSYTQLEYEYALSMKIIPIFSVVLSEDFLNRKALANEAVEEHENKYLYGEFKEVVMKKMIKTVDDCKDIKLAIYESISELKEENDFEGWTRGISSAAYENLTGQIASLVKENSQLKEQLKQFSVVQQTREADDQFWNKSFHLNIHGMKECMKFPYDSAISITMHDIFMELAPLMMVSVKLHRLKNRYEEVLHEKYANQYYSLSIEENQFQHIKILIYSKRLIMLQKDHDGEESVSLTQQGMDALCRLGEMEGRSMR